MAIMDYKTIETTKGEFDITLPLSKNTAKADLLFQQVELLLNSYAGDFLYDITQGMPYDRLLGEAFDLTELERAYYDRISTLIYFKDIDNFDIDIDNERNINVSFRVIAEDNTSQQFEQGL